MCRSFSSYLRCATNRSSVFKQVFFLPVLLCLASAAVGQDISVTGKFGKDTLKIGQPVPYTLTARYPKELNVVFPDSSFAFTPFEFQKKIFYPTTTRDGISADSVVYYLSTFEVDSIQQLALPIFVIHKRDCTAVQSTPDSVYVVQLVKHVPDSVATEKLALKTNTDYQKVSWIFNYPVALIVIGSLIVLALLTWIIFGKSIRRHFLVKRLNRNHNQFTERFDQLVGQLKANFSPQKAESAVVLWKTYMEDLLSQPYPKLTSREIFTTEKDERLGQSLRKIDRTIYGGEQAFAEEPFLNLRDYTDLKFKKKLEEVQYGQRS